MSLKPQRRRRGRDPGVLALLADAGCDQAQGCPFAKPRPAAEFASWLQRLSGEERAAA